jgi:hypothetical protein
MRRRSLFQCLSTTAHHACSQKSQVFIVIHHLEAQDKSRLDVKKPHPQPRATFSSITAVFSNNAEGGRAEVSRSGDGTDLGYQVRAAGLLVTKFYSIACCVVGTERMLLSWSLPWNHTELRGMLMVEVRK